MRSKILILLLFLLSLTFCGKREIKGEIKDLADITSRVTIGEYQFIEGMYVDYRGNVYIPNISRVRIDKYSPEGKFLLSFGRKGEGPGEFKYVPSFAVNTDGMVYAIDITRKISIFNPDGTFLKYDQLPGFQKGIPFMPRFSPKNQLVFSLYMLEENRSQKPFPYVEIYLLTRKKRAILLFKDKSKANTMHLFALKPFLNFNSHYDFDTRGNIYISDPVFYKVYVFNTEGKKIREFSRECKREKITEKDLEVTSPEIKKEIGDFLNMAKKEISKLSGDSKYLPCIFNINVDRGKIYLWRPTRVKGKFIVDIYTTDFKYLGKRAFYNTTGNINNNTTFISNGFLYILDVIPENTNALNGRLLTPRLPSSVLKFRLIPL